MKRKSSDKAGGLTKIEGIKEIEFESLEDLNDWVKKASFDIQPINIQKYQFVNQEVYRYILFYGKIE